jgi:hypothetical protein
MVLLGLWGVELANMEVNDDGGKMWRKLPISDSPKAIILSR